MERQHTEQAITVRAVREDDFEAVHKLLHQLWPDKEIKKASLYVVFRAMLNNSGYGMLCAELRGTMAGFACLSVQHNLWEEGFILYITTMIVDERHRRQGAGTAMVKAIERIAKDSGCRRIELESSFHRTAAHEFYEKNGFNKRAYFFSKQIGT